ncbi:MAG: PD-(D/E)XK nuclease family protein [Gemmatimonadetes bacterium]|nr:PD-(D/E)XK nuclease family protein [Gemmatimonadota bacterium]
MDGASVYLQGSMDLAAQVGDAREILDVKTHAIQPGEEWRTAAGYRLQRHIYATALAELTGHTPASMGFFFAATREHVCTPPSSSRSSAFSADSLFASPAQPARERIVRPPLGTTCCDAASRRVG